MPKRKERIAPPPASDGWDFRCAHLAEAESGIVAGRAEPSRAALVRLRGHGSATSHVTRRSERAVLVWVDL